jgi:DNA repair photolyase
MNASAFIPVRDLHINSRFKIRETEARGILSATSGFIAAAGFTHSLSPARNCTYGCIYCYVPTMRVRGGLRPEDWRRWGQFTTFKSNAAALLNRSLRGDEIIYCSPLVDPYQPAEASRRLMPAVLEALLRKPPRVFVVQTRGTLILRDLALLVELSRRTTLRVGFSITTDREEIRKLYEPHCEPVPERFVAVRALREAGIITHATLAPLLPCDPEKLARLALEATGRDLIGDPLHVRSVKRHGATTREAAAKVGAIHGHLPWFDAAYQEEIVERIRQVASGCGRRFGVGPEGFGWLAAGT